MNGRLSVETTTTDGVHFATKYSMGIQKIIIIKTVIICMDNRTLKDLLITLLVYYIKCTNLYYNKNALIYANATSSSAP
jgi:hypothetical protein